MLAAILNAMTQRNPGGEPAHLLVIGYGNTLRRDDGAGPWVAEAVAALDLPGVRTLVRHQLTPELADPIAAAGTVVFVDACAVATAAVGWGRLAPADSAQILAHAANPATLLALARQLFGRAPEAWLLTVPASDFAFGEGLSPATQRHCPQAVQHICALAEGVAQERATH